MCLGLGTEGKGGWGGGGVNKELEEEWENYWEIEHLQ